MNQEQVNDAVKKHGMWLRDEEGGERWSCEWHEDFSGADLSRADLSGADLSDADLSDADLSRAVLSGADLRGANLSGAVLSDADLSDANLSRADLSGADLRGADLSGAVLHGAVLSGAVLRGAKDIPELVYGLTLIATSEIKTGWKKLSGDLICKLEIPPEAKRSNATGRKCRCEYAKVIEIWDGDKQVDVGYSNWDTEFQYKVGEIVRPNQWDDNRWNECSNGIHFFLTRVEAEDY